jgi:hypothetical protein
LDWSFDLDFDEAEFAHDESEIAPATNNMIASLFTLDRGCCWVVLMPIAILSLHILYMNRHAETVPILIDDGKQANFDEQHWRGVVFLAIRW